MKYKAKESYKSLDAADSFLGLGMASKHIWLIEGQEIEYNGKMPKAMSKHLEEVKSKEQK
jgi:hypothetical protein|tara:strand:+ start:1952 stop:2131 length:180 start_codon:yes stop_codon:yes gene_type:complete